MRSRGPDACLQPDGQDLPVCVFVCYSGGLPYSVRKHDGLLQCAEGAVSATTTAFPEPFWESFWDPFWIRCGLKPSFAELL